jgi:RND superfamily putative drug exporter
MFSVLARFAHKYKFFILAGWIILTALLIFTAPSLSKVGVTDQSQFLPQNTQSARVRELLNTKFPRDNESSASSAIIVVYNEKGLSQPDMDRAKAVCDWLNSKGKPAAVDSVVSTLAFSRRPAFLFPR